MLISAGTRRAAGSRVSAGRNFAAPTARPGKKKPAAKTCREESGTREEESRARQKGRAEENREEARAEEKTAGQEAGEEVEEEVAFFVTPAERKREPGSRFSDPGSRRCWRNGLPGMTDGQKFAQAGLCGVSVASPAWSEIPSAAAFSIASRRSSAKPMAPAAERISPAS